jgi:hypothetical protein
MRLWRNDWTTFVVRVASAAASPIAARRRLMTIPAALSRANSMATGQPEALRAAGDDDARVAVALLGIDVHGGVAARREACHCSRAGTSSPTRCDPAPPAWRVRHSVCEWQATQSSLFSARPMPILAHRTAPLIAST